jgi:Domain of unknown function (DUF4365)
MIMKVYRPPSAQVGSLGVAVVRLVIERDLRWVFREQTTEDYGIDAHVEIVEDNVVSGKLLGLQIKSGLSWFAAPGPGGWWYRPRDAHVQYWTHHSLPVVVVLHHPGTGRCHWQLVNQDAVERTATGGWRMLVMDAHVLDERAREPLTDAAVRRGARASDQAAFVPGDRDPSTGNDDQRSLPDQVAGRMLTQPQRSPPTVASGPGRPRLLIVEDQVGPTIKHLLAGYECELVTSVEMWWQLVEDGDLRFDAALVDLHLTPKMNDEYGGEVLRFLHERTPPIPALLMSVSPTGWGPELQRQYGAVGVFYKDRENRFRGIRQAVDELLKADRA